MLKKISIFCFLFTVIFCGGAFADDTRDRINTRRCIDGLVDDIVDNMVRNWGDGTNEILIYSDGLIEYFFENINVCRGFLLDSDIEHNIAIYNEEIGLFMDIDWEYIRTEVAAFLSVQGEYRVLSICQNRRMAQSVISGLLVGVTVVASLKLGPAAGGLIVGGVRKIKGKLVTIGIRRAATGAAGRAATQAAAQTTAQTAARTAAQTAKRNVVQNFPRNTHIQQAQRNLAQGVPTRGGGTLTVGNSTNPTRNVGRLKAELNRMQRLGSITPAQHNTAINALTSHADALRAASAAASAANKAAANLTGLVTQSGTASAHITSAIQRHGMKGAIVGTGLGTVYGLTTSRLNAYVMNCGNISHNQGCYLNCDNRGRANMSVADDDFNRHVGLPILRQNICSDRDSLFIMREVNDGVAGDVFVTTQERWRQARQAITSRVARQGRCLGPGIGPGHHANDIDVYVGIPMFDPSTLRPFTSGASIPSGDAVGLNRHRFRQ